MEAILRDRNFTVSSGRGSSSVSPGTAIQSVVDANPAGTTFVPANRVCIVCQLPSILKNGDSFVGQTACAPPTTSCSAILSGSTVIGSSAVFRRPELQGDWAKHSRVRRVRALRTVIPAGWLAFIPRTCFFNGVPYQHLSSSTLPPIGPGQWWFRLHQPDHLLFTTILPGHTVETSVVTTAFGGAAK